MYSVSWLYAMFVLVQTLPQTPATSGPATDVTTYRTTRSLTSAQRARAAMQPKYGATPLTSASSGLSSSNTAAAQSKATALVSLNRAKRSSQYVPEDINDKATWKRQGIATATPWEREVGGWDKRPDWKPKSTWDGTLTRVSGGNLAGTATSGRQSFDTKHPNLVVNGKVPVKRR